MENNYVNQSWSLVDRWVREVVVCRKGMNGLDESMVELNEQTNERTNGERVF